MLIGSTNVDGMAFFPRESIIQRPRDVCNTPFTLRVGNIFLATTYWIPTDVMMVGDIKTERGCYHAFDDNRTLYHVFLCLQIHTFREFGDMWFVIMTHKGAVLLSEDNMWVIETENMIIKQRLK